jgi:hypothetical protein
VYHWETEQEDFLVLSGEALLIVEGEERPLKQWDFVHCPPETRHVFVGAGDGACVILAASSRQFQASGPWGFYRSTRPPGATTPVPRRRRRTATSPMHASRPRTRSAIATACYRLVNERSLNSTQDRLGPPWLSFCSSITHRD